MPLVISERPLPDAQRGGCAVGAFNVENYGDGKLYTGDELPCIGMGTFGSSRFASAQVSKAVSGAIEVGCRLFDCAVVYGTSGV